MKIVNFSIPNTRVRSRFDTFFTILFSKATPISRNDLMPQKRLSYHKLCQQTGRKSKILSCCEYISQFCEVEITGTSQKPLCKSVSSQLNFS